MTAADKLRFGTDGWRDLIGERFTHDNVARAAQAYAEVLLEDGTPSVVVGYDTRFGAERFGRVVAEVMAANGVETRLSASYLPTPALSFAAKHYGAGGGVMLTASHNPPDYLGFKLKGAFGGSATPQTYERVSARVAEITKQRVRPFSKAQHRYTTFDIREAYFTALASLVDLDILRSFQGSLVYDAMGGAGAGWLQGFFEYANLSIDLDLLREAPNPTFYGVNPEPITPNLALTMEKMTTSRAVFATATDGDGDRLGLVLPGGTFFNSHQIFAVLLEHLHRKGLTGQVVKTFTVSRMIERLATGYGLPVLETPVGFKYIAQAMLKTDVLIGGEESGGIGVAGHLPERDGLANSLLMLEAVVASGSSVAELFSELERKTDWQHAYDRLDLHLADSSLKDAVMNSLTKAPSTFADRHVSSVERRDGVKLNFSDAWLLFRASGTEPLLRVYCEAQDQDSVHAILAKAEAFVLEQTPEKAAA